MEENKNRNQERPSPNRTGENLLRQISAEEIFRKKGYFQSIVLDVLTVGAALGSSYSLKRFFEDGAVIPLAVSVCLLVMFSCFEVFLIKGLARRFFILVFETIALLSFFSQEPFGLLLAAGAAIIALLFWGEILSRSEARNLLEIRFFKIAGPLVKKTITALSLLIVLLYLPQWSKGDNLISKKWFEAAAASSIQTAEGLYSELNFHSTVRDFALSLAKYELKGNEVFGKMPQAAQKATVDQIAGQIVEGANTYANKYAGTNLSGKETISEVLYAAVASTLERLRISFGNWFLLAWAAGVFLLIRGLGAFFWWIPAFLGFSVYKLLLALNVFCVRGESAVRETVEFS